MWVLSRVSGVPGTLYWSTPSTIHMSYVGLWIPFDLSYLVLSEVQYTTSTSTHTDKQVYYKNSTSRSKNRFSRTMTGYWLKASACDK